MPAQVRMVALSRICHGATLALAMAQLHSNLDLCLLEPSFPVGADEEKTKELTGNFTTMAEAIMVATHVGDVVLAAFFEP